MEIKGPFKLGIVEMPEASGRELHLSFTEEFRKMEPAVQVAMLRQYIDELDRQIAGNSHETAEKQGMQTMLYIARELLPHIEADEIPLEETIVIEVKTEDPLGGMLRPDQYH